MQAIAQQPRSTKEFLEPLFIHGDEHVHESVVGHASATQNIFQLASNDKEDSAEYRLTRDNPNVADSTLNVLATNDPDEIVRLIAGEALLSR
jgi:hypothetical protein